MANWSWFMRAHRKVFELTGGRVGAKLAGLDMIFVSTIGRRTGAVHTVPIACYPHEGDVLVVASNNGQDADPMWWKNLKAHPEVDAQLGTVRMRVRAEEVTGAEREALWRIIVQKNPIQARHQKNTSRLLPVVRLRRTST